MSSRWCLSRIIIYVLPGVLLFIRIMNRKIDWRFHLEFSITMWPPSSLYLLEGLMSQLLTDHPISCLALSFTTRWVNSSRQSFPLEIESCHYMLVPQVKEVSQQISFQISLIFVFIFLWREKAIVPVII